MVFGRSGAWNRSASETLPEVALQMEENLVAEIL